MSGENWLVIAGGENPIKCERSEYSALGLRHNDAKICGSMVHTFLPHDLTFFSQYFLLFQCH